MSQNSNPVRPALIFIPDISGFTQFVSQTEIKHSQHIIQELLEIMIESNTLGMQISEIEGDAILFYRFGIAPTAAELLAQVQKMFVNFHHHLNKYLTHRICSCGACKSAPDLTLKFIAHYGNITESTVKNFRKLFGKEVIVAHRLLKNQIEHHEYALFTNPLVNACSNWVEVPTVAWTEVQHQAETYDSGKIEYCYLALAPLMDYIPELELEDYSVPGLKKQMFHSEVVIEAPLEMVFNVMADLPWRTKWIVGSMDSTQNLNHKILQTGATHRCLAKGPIVVTHNFEQATDSITFTETDTKRQYCVVYNLEKINTNRTLAKADCFMKKHFFMNSFFNLFMKKNMLQTYAGSWKNLNAYCKSLLETSKTHPYEIVLEEKKLVA